MAVLLWWGHLPACACASLLLLESSTDKESVWFPAGSSVIKEMSSTTSRLDSKLASGDAYPLGLPKAPLCHPGKICSLQATALIPRHADWEGDLAGTESSAQNGTKCSQQNYPTELALHPAGIASEEWLCYKVPLQTPSEAFGLLGCKSQGKSSWKKKINLSGNIQKDLCFYAIDNLCFICNICAMCS